MSDGVAHIRAAFRHDRRGEKAVAAASDVAQVHK